MNINIKLAVSTVFLLTPKSAAKLDYTILLLGFSLSVGLLELPPQHEVAARFCAWKEKITDHLLTY